MAKIVHQGDLIFPTDHPFSQVVEANGFVYLAGQCGNRPPAEGRVPGGTEAETRQALENVGRLLRSIGLDYSDVASVLIHMCNINEFETMNRIYSEYFPSEHPARTTVGVTRLAGDYNIEITVVAAR